MPVVQHSPVHDALRVLGEMLQVLVMRRDDPERTVAIEAVEQRLGDRPAYLRLRAPAELVNQ